MPEDAPPHKRRRVSRGAKWVVVLGTLLALALGLFAGLRWGVPRYLESEDFRRRLSQKTAGLVDAPGGYQPLSWREASATSDGFLAQGAPERSLQALQARGLTAQFDWSGLWQRKIIIQRLTVEQIQAAFSAKRAEELEKNLAPPPLEPPSKGKSAVQVDLREVVVNRATILWGETDEEFGAFREVALRLWPVDKNLSAYGEGGTFQIGSLPQAGIRQFQLRYEKPVLTIEWGTMTVGGESAIEVGGVFAFTQPGSMDLRLGFRRCPIAPFLESETRSKFDGVFESETRLRKELGDDKPVTLAGPVRVTGAVVRNIPALGKLAAFTSEPRFKTLHFQTLHGSYRYTKPKLEVDDLTAEAEGLFQVEGSLAVEGKQLRGTVQLGVSAKVLECFPGAREEVFTKPRNEYYWTTVKLSGTTEEPEHDLKERLLDAAKKHPVKTEAVPVKKTIDIIKKPVEAVFDKLKELFGN